MTNTTTTPVHGTHLTVSVRQIVASGIYEIIVRDTYTDEIVDSNHVSDASYIGRRVSAMLNKAVAR